MNQPQKKSFPAGTYIFRQGQPRDYIYIIESGKVEITFESETEASYPLAKLGPKGIFGEVALVEKGPRSASAKALQNTICTMLTPAMFNQQMNCLPASMVSIFSILSHRLTATNKKLGKALDEVEKYQQSAL